MPRLSNWHVADLSLIWFMLFGALPIEAVRIFVEALLPPVLYCAAGAIADHFLEFDSRSLSRLAVYIFLPPLVFSTLMEVEVSVAEVMRVAGFMVLVLTTMAASALLYARWLRLDAGTTSSASLAVTFFNGVNLGFPVALYAFGEKGLLLAGVLVAVNSIPHNVFGLFIAARGTLPTREALRALARMPFLYVLGLAVLLRLASVKVPDPILNPISVLGRAAIPLALVCVGIELRRIKARAITKELFGVVALRLLFAPVVAWLVADLVGLTGLLRAVVILQASMPSAVMPIVYARLFGGNVEFISRAVFYSTISSAFTIPILLIFLDNG